MRKGTLGKILGGNGLLLLFPFAPWAYFTVSPAVGGGVALVGLGLIAAYFATNYGQIGQFASRRSTFFIVSSAALGVAVLVALTAVNYIAAKRNKTWDLTKNQIFTLAPQTRSTLEGIKEKVTAIAFLPADHPYLEVVQNLLKRYHDQAPDKFEYSFKDPRKEPKLAAQYQLKQAEATVVLTRGTGDQAPHTSVNVISEQDLTNALIKLNAVGEQKVYFVVGHGEWPLDTGGGPQDPMKASHPASLSELRRSLSQEGYAPEELNLAGKTEVPRDASLVVIASPAQPVTEKEVDALRSYLNEGGRLLYFTDYGRDTGPHLAKLLSDWGVEVDSGLVADDRFAVDSPYMVLSLFFGDHEITRVLKEAQMSVQFPTVRGLTVLHQGMLEGVTPTPVVLSSPFAWVETDPTEEPSRSNGEKTGQIPLVVAVTRPTASAPGKRYDEARLVVFGDSELLVDANWGHEGNRNLVLNALGWASNEVAKITIRPPDRDISSLDIDPSMMSQIRLVSLNLLPLALLSLGLTIWLKRRNQ